jgi:hypothetical protein
VHQETTLDEVKQTAEAAVRHPWIKRLARLGFYTKGCLFIVIGIIAFSVVAGVRGARLTDARGALAEVAKEPYGRAFLFIFVIGAIGHGSWNILRSITDVDGLGRNWKAIIARVIQGLIGIFYLGLAASAVDIILAASASTDGSLAEETFIGIVLTVPLLGAAFILIIGLGLIGAGFHECYSGITGRFQSVYRTWEIKRPHRIFISLLGVLSFTVRAVLMAIMGWYFLKAAVLNKAVGSVGIDGALLALLGTSYGRALLLVAAVGLIGHGVLAFYEARFRRIC